MVLPELFLSCDWGTSRFRLRLAELANGRVLQETTAGPGVAELAALAPADQRPELYRARLLEAINSLSAQVKDPQLKLAELPVVISGMASSSLGWCELPYAPLPFALDGSSAGWRNIGPLQPDQAAGSPVILISGVRSATDVMRGEETEALGAWQLPLARSLGSGAWVILPGTHSKQALLRDGALVQFRTFMTGELFDVLGRHSVLRHSLPDRSADAPAASAAVSPQQPDEPPGDAFRQGVQCAALLPLASALFQVRTGALLAGRKPPESAEFLSGLLIGHELQALRNPELEPWPILLCGAGALSVRYAAAASTLGLDKRLSIVPAAAVSQLAVLGQATVLRNVSTSL